MTIRIPGTLTNPDSMESSYVFCFFFCGSPGYFAADGLEHPTMHEDGTVFPIGNGDFQMSC